MAIGDTSEVETVRKQVRDSYERFERAVEAEREMRNGALEDIKFSLGGDEQWDPDVLTERDEEGRPHLTNNKLPAFVHQVCNNQRQNRPAVITSPVSSGADQDTSAVLQGLVRHIEYRSDADSAYDTATEFAVRGGFGYIRILTEYEDEMSFNQEIRIQRIDNPFSVYMDPAACQPDRSDAKWCQIGEWLHKDEYNRLFSKSDLAKEADWDALGDNSPSWLEDERCRVIEEFVKEYTKVKIFLGSDKQAYKEDDVKKFIKAGGTIIHKNGEPVWRWTQLPSVRWKKINGIEVLEEQLWPGSIIPVVAVMGKELNVDGTRRVEGMIRQARDPQRMVNFYATALAEAIALAPKSPWLVPIGGDEGLEKEYSEVNQRNLSILHYRASDAQGKELPRPAREVVEPAIQAINHAYLNSGEDLKAALGMFDPSLGNRDAAQSGVAIRNLQSQGDTANFHFADNLHKSIRQIGRILIDLIPKIYDTERVVRIIGTDDKPRQVTVNSQAPPAGNPIDEKSGVAQIYDLTTGKYDVTVKAGPSFQSRRQEEAAFMLEVLRTNPQLMQTIGDLVFKMQDSPGAQEISERLAKTLPPQLQQQDSNGDQQIPPQIKSMLDQQSTAIQILTQHLHAAQDELEDKKIELASKERVALYQTRAQVLGKLAEIHSKMGMDGLELELQQIENRIDLLNQEQPLAPDTPATDQGAAPSLAGPGQMMGQPQPATGGDQTPGQPQGGIPNA